MKNLNVFTSTEQTASIYDSYIKLNMMNVFKSEQQYKFSIKKDFDTACWSFINDTHNIYVGDSIYERIKSEYSDFDNIIYKYIAHEAGHACFTTRDFEDLNKKLNAEKVPFQLYNLFEDARIEHLMRVNFGIEFKWTDFEDLDADRPDEKALTTFFKIIQSENREIFDVPYYERVKDFYDRTLTADTIEKMITVLKDWIKEFPNETEPNKSQQKGMSMQGMGEPGEGSPKGAGQSTDEMSDLEIGVAIATNEDFKDKFESDTEVVVQDAESAKQELQEELNINNETSANMKHLTEVKSEQLKTLASSNVDDMFDKNAKFNPKKIHEDKIEEAKRELIKILKDMDTERINMSTPSNYFNIKGAMAFMNGDSRAKLYKSNVDEDEVYNKKKVFILIDGSSSMGGHPVKNALTLSVVLNRLSKLNLFEGYIAGSKVAGKAINQGFELPINDGMITSFRADAGGEGIGYAIKQNVHLMNDCDYIFVITDGQIHDMDLNMLKKEHPEVYKKTVGVYMGNSRHANKSLDKWFKFSIVNNEFIDTIKDIAKMLDPNADSRNMINNLTKDVDGKILMENYMENSNLDVQNGMQI